MPGTPRGDTTVLARAHVNTDLPDARPSNGVDFRRWLGEPTQVF